jgi:hypothetical protein
MKCEHKFEVQHLREVSVEVYVNLNVEDRQLVNAGSFGTRQQ